MKNKKIYEFSLPNQARPLCVKFGLKSRAIMACGDDRNVISLWRLNKEIPLATLASPQGTGSKDAGVVSAVCIALNQVQVLSGSSVGHFNVWDIQTQKVLKNFKEHSALVSCISPSTVVSPEYVVITGSHDSTVKEWDIRQKESSATYNEHKMRINCVDLSTDGKSFVTGSDDCLLKVWDLRTRKLVKTLNSHKSPISCVKFNPEANTLATTSLDGVINYWDLKTYDLMFSSNIDNQKIHQIVFDHTGKYFFTAAENALKTWKVTEENLSLMHHIESKWNSIQDLVIENSSKSATNAVIGAVMGQTSFEVWGSSFENLDKLYKEPVAIFSKSQAQQEEEEYGDDDRDVPDEMMNPQVLKRLDQPVLRGSQKFEHFSDVVKCEPKEAEADGNECVMEREVEQEETKGDKEKAQEEYSGQQIEENLEINELLESTKSVRDTIIRLEQHSPTELDLSELLKKGLGDKKKMELDTIGEISQDHAKFEDSIVQRTRNIQEISSTWKTERALKTLPAIENLTARDAPLILSLITVGVIAHRIERLPLDIVCTLLRKVHYLLETNFDLYIRVGMGFSLTVLEAFDKEIIPRKGIHTPGKVGQPKGEIPRKYSKLISTFEWFSQLQVLKKLSEKSDTQLGKIAKRVIVEFGAFLTKVNGQNKAKK